MTAFLKGVSMPALSTRYTTAAISCMMHKYASDDCRSSMPGGVSNLAPKNLPRFDNNTQTYEAMFTGIRYDSCSTSTAYSDNTTIFSHVFDINRHAHASPCQHQRGITGGNSVATAGDLRAASAGAEWNKMIAVESDLRGQTRGLTRCPAYDYIPKKGVISSVEPIKPVQHPVIQTDSFKAPEACQMIQYRNLPGPNNPSPES